MLVICKRDQKEPNACHCKIGIIFEGVKKAHGPFEVPNRHQEAWQGFFGL